MKRLRKKKKEVIQEKKMQQSEVVLPVKKPKLLTKNY